MTIRCYQLIPRLYTNNILPQSNNINPKGMQNHGLATFHTVTESEKRAFCHHLNVNLDNDVDLKNLMPINEKSIFEAIIDGVLLCKFINVAVPGTIPEIAINKSHPLNIFQKSENLNLAISSAKSIGCIVVNIHANSIIEKKEHIAFGLLWQIVRIHIFRRINLREVPEIVVLAKEGEEPETMYKLRPEEILIRWFNYYIRRSNETRQISNLGKDLADGFAYGHVYSHISNDWKEDFWQLDSKQRAVRIIQLSEKLGFRPWVRAEDITDGNLILNTLLSTQIFNHRHGLVLEGKKVPVVVVESETDETREIKIYKNWINSMGLEDTFLTYLIEGLKDGRVYLRVIERLRPGSVDWNKFSPKSQRIFIVQNCNYVIDLCKNHLKIEVHNIGGVDIVDGKVTLNLGLLWQLCRIYWQERCGDISEDKLLEWANGRVPNQYQVKSLKDKTIADCMFLIKVIQSIDERVIDEKFLDKSNTAEAKEANIKYTISSARKIGAEVMLLWEHIFEANNKFIYTFLTELRYQAKRLNK